MTGTSKSTTYADNDAYYQQLAGQTAYQNTLTPEQITYLQTYLFPTGFGERTGKAAAEVERDYAAWVAAGRPTAAEPPEGTTDYETYYNSQPKWLGYDASYVAPTPLAALSIERAQIDPSLLTQDPAYRTAQNRWLRYGDLPYETTASYMSLGKLMEDLGGTPGFNLAEGRAQTTDTGEVRYIPWTEQDLAQWVNRIVPSFAPRERDYRVYSNAKDITYKLLLADQARRAELFAPTDIRSIIPLGTEADRYNTLYGWDPHTSFTGSDWLRTATLAVVAAGGQAIAASMFPAATAAAPTATGAAGATGGAAAPTLGSSLAGLDEIIVSALPYTGSPAGALVGGTVGLGSALTSQSIPQPPSDGVSGQGMDTVEVTTTPYNPNAGLDPGLLTGIGGVPITATVPKVDIPDNPAVEIPQDNPTDKPTPAQTAREKLEEWLKQLTGLEDPTKPAPPAGGGGPKVEVPGSTENSGSDSKPRGEFDYTDLLWGFLEEEGKNRERQKQQSLGAALSAGGPNYGPKVFGLDNNNLAAQIQLAVQTNSRARGGPYGL